MQTAAIQSGPSVLSMPLMQETNMATRKEFDLGQKMPGMTTMQLNDNYRMAGIGKILDLST